MSPFQLAEWTVVPDRNELISSAGATRTLEPKAMELLVRLAAAPGEVVSKELLLRDVWNGAHVVEHVLPKTMSALRKALGDDAQASRFIRTVPRRGYVLVMTPEAVPDAPVETVADAPSEVAPTAERKLAGWRVPLLRIVAAAVILAIGGASLFLLRGDGKSTVALFPTRAPSAVLSRDAGDALAHDLARYSCLAVRRAPADAEFRVESNVVDLGGARTLRTRLLRDGVYVAAADTPSAVGVAGASPAAAKRLVQHICRHRRASR